jgi:hypothetical protein
MTARKALSRIQVGNESNRSLVRAALMHLREIASYATALVFQEAADRLTQARIGNPVGRPGRCG